MTRDKIVLIGDFLLNQFYYGKVIQVAKDAPVPVVNITKTERYHGSAGLVAEVLSRLGVIPNVVGIVGNDNAGRWIRESLQESKIPLNNIIVDNRTKTSTISRVIANSIQISRFDEITRINHDKKIKEKLFEMIEKQFKTSRLAVICDYDFGLLTEDITDKIISESEKRGVDLFVSSTGTNYLRYKDSNAVIKINTDNAVLLIKEQGTNLSSTHILDGLEKILHTERILLTRSHEGIAVYEDGVITEMPATQNKAMDIKGIGEVMIAAIIYSLSSKNNFLEACKVGNIAAGIAASKGDVSSVSKKDIMYAKKEYDTWLEQK